MRNVLVVAGAGLRGRRRSGTIATFLVLTLAAVGISAGLVVSRQGAPVLDAVADRADVAHLVLFGDPDAIEAVAADPEVVAWSGPYATVGDLELLVGGEKVPVRATALDDPDIAVNRPPMRSGVWAAQPDEIVLDRSLAADLGIGLGDDVTFALAGAETTFRVVGTAVDFTDCFYPQCEPGRVWVTTAGLDRFRASDDATFAQGWLRFDDPAQADPFVERQAASGIEGISGTESWLDTRADFLVLDRVFGAFLSAFGVFVLVVAAVIVAGSMAMRVVSRRREIGLLGSVGCTPRQISLGLLIENVGVGVVAAVAGWYLAGFLAPSLQVGIGRTLGPQDATWTALGLTVSVLAIVLILVVATVVPSTRAARRPVTDVLRDVPPGRVSGLTRRVSGLPSRLSWLGAQEAATQPVRTALAALAIVVAIVGTLVSVGFVGGVGAVDDDPAVAGDPWDVTLIPGEAEPAVAEAALASTAGVDRWFSEVERRSTLDEGAFLSVATGGDPAAADYRIAGGRSMVAAGEGIAGYGFLERFGVSVGDEVDIRAGTAPLHIRIVGWYRDTEDSGEVLRYRMATLQAAEPGVTPTSYRVVLDDGADADSVGASLVARLGGNARYEILDTGVADMAPMLLALRLVALVLLLMAGVNLLSTLLTSTREAAGRIGVELAIGFTPGQLRRQGAVTGLATGALAAVVAVPLGYWVFGLLADAVSTSLGVGPGWMPAPGVASVAVLVIAALAASAALGALAVARSSRRPASDLLRRE